MGREPTRSMYALSGFVFLVGVDDDVAKGETRKATFNRVVWAVYGKENVMLEYSLRSWECTPRDLPT